MHVFLLLGLSGSALEPHTEGLIGLARGFLGIVWWSKLVVQPPEIGPVTGVDLPESYKVEAAE